MVGADIDAPLPRVWAADGTCRVSRHSRTFQGKYPFSQSLDDGDERQFVGDVEEVLLGGLARDGLDLLHKRLGA